jgi:site-specific DNA-methyltransferase (adenine-specific)
VTPYYEADGITIYHGDSREISIEHGAVATDPPYGISYRQPRKCLARESVVGDSAWFYPRPSVPFVIWGANNSGDYADCGWLVWDKLRYGADLFGDGELAATNCRRGVHIFKSRWDRQHGDGWTGSHPTEKPLSLMEWAVGFLPDGAPVLDPFMGSGTTLVAAKNLGRKAIGIEIEERYCEIAAERLSQGVLGLGA